MRIRLIPLALLGAAAMASHAAAQEPRVVIRDNVRRVISTMPRPSPNASNRSPIAYDPASPFVIRRVTSTTRSQTMRRQSFLSG